MERKPTGRKPGRPRKNQTTPQAATTTVDDGIPEVDPGSMTEGGPHDVPDIPCVPPIPEVTNQDSVMVELPLGELPGKGYLSKHIDVSLNAKQAKALRRVTIGAENAGRRLANGRRIVDNPGAIRHILEKIADTMPE